MTRRILTLTEDQRLQLLELRDHDPRPYVRERGAALLKIADGDSPHRVASNGLLKTRDPDTVSSWLDRYQASGAPAAGGGGPRGPPPPPGGVVWGGGFFSSAGPILERLRQGPGEEARRE